jgi:hypothetical protein
MGLDVSVPPAPRLNIGYDTDDYEDADVGGDEYRREDLQTFLERGAWEEAFEQWTESAEMTTEEFEIATDLDLVSRFDFFWDDFADRVGYHAPGLPEDWREREIHPDIESWNTVSSINAGLTELGQVVCETLKEEYVDWEAEYEAPDDLPDF